ncbi:unnamed protein product [Trichobilharzia regenti]|nr:unnamed protein product [Trichobilharzia regenti]
MSWTSDEIIGPSFEKTKRFIDHMLQPCGYEETVSVRNREATTVNASGTNITNTTVNNISSNSTTSNATISNTTTTTTTTTTTVSSMNDENNKRPSLSASSYVTSEYQLPYHPTFILPRYPANDKY